MQQISNNVFVVEGSKSSAILQLTGWRDQSFGTQSTWAAQQDVLKHVRWGAGDSQPNLMRKLLENNDQVKAELEAIRDMIYGTGGVFLEKQPDGTNTPYYDQALEDWAEETDLESYEIEAIANFLESANVFTRFAWDIETGRPVLSVSDAFATRIAKPESLQKGITAYQVNPYFGEWLHFDNKDTQLLEAFDAKTLSTSLAQMCHSKVRAAGNPFYSFPSWWCAKDWIELANLIPIFHTNGIKNGYNIKYIIKMPADYFDAGAGGKKPSDKEVAGLWGDFEQNMRKVLSGEKQVNKSMIIRYLRGGDGKAMDSIDVQALPNLMSDDAYHKILLMADKSIASAIGLLPTLAGVNPGQGNDSGSQIRVMADYQQNFRTTVPRKIITKPINLAIKMLNPTKYKNVFRWYNGVQITTLDTNPNGSSKVSTLQSGN